ncbi:MAG: hypothetical protein K940chlam5_01678 [Candidatus Anoxychlamydiales bacterium]|nr:hypothetical protein [Candidatus Anoxychlamydiales bacterium]
MLDKAKKIDNFIMNYANLDYNDIKDDTRNGLTGYYVLGATVVLFVLTGPFGLVISPTTSLIAFWQFQQQF